MPRAPVHKRPQAWEQRMRSAHSTPSTYAHRATAHTGQQRLHACACKVRSTPEGKQGKARKGMVIGGGWLRSPCLWR